MDKKLPKVFANKIEKEFNNNERVYYERSNEPIKISEKVSEKTKENKLNISEEFTINQKINKIFGSSKYVYKANVTIKLKDGNTVDKKVIGRNKKELITMDNELIKISDISDIKFSDN